jgi:peptidoglycan/xylan/chitin deacetylase (PgdA/CDA1 family)
MNNDLPAIFPDNRRAAVSLTYDDALDQHLDLVMPQLESYDLRGTFYVPTRTKNSAWITRPTDWKIAAERGKHEIANHTQYHPCGMKGRDWVKPNFSLEAYSLARIEQELVEASKDIAAVIGEQGPISYAYTCGDDWVGPNRESYRPTVARLFPAARGGANRKLVDPYDCDLNFATGWGMFEATKLPDVFAFIDEAIEQGHWAILIFHGVGGGHNINVSAKFHLEILDHIANRRDRIYCDTFINIAKEIAKTSDSSFSPR